MTPPVHEGVLEHSRVVIEGFGRAATRRRISGRDIAAIADTWIILLVLWGARVISGPMRATEIVFAVLTLAAVSTSKARPERLTPSALDDAPSMFTRVWLAYAATCAISVIGGLGAEMELLTLALPMAPALVVGRAVSYATHRGLSRTAEKARALVVGGGEAADRVISTIEQHDEYGLKLIGMAADDSMNHPTRLLGDPSSVAELVDAYNVDVVIVATSHETDKKMSSVLRKSLQAGAKVWIVPKFFELGCGSFGDHLWGLPVVRLMPPARTRPGWTFKRALDIVLSAAALTLLAPVFGAIALLTYLDSGRPIFLKQRRVGLDGEGFDMLKFRTMRPLDPEQEAVEWTAGEDRITKVGRVLRNTSLDELPQFVNVLKGEMSLVGPRPERPHFVDLFSDQYPDYAERHRLPAGVTGWSQVHGLRGDTSIEERAAFDNYYVDNWSLSQDVKILVRTLTAFRHDMGGRG